VCHTRFFIVSKNFQFGPFALKYERLSLEDFATLPLRHLEIKPDDRPSLSSKGFLKKQDHNNNFYFFTCYDEGFQHGILDRVFDV
jgi:hypothetical protein